MVINMALCWRSCYSVVTCDEVSVFWLLYHRVRVVLVVDEMSYGSSWQ